MNVVHQSLLVLLVVKSLDTTLEQAWTVTMEAVETLLRRL